MNVEVHTPDHQQARVKLEYVIYKSQSRIVKYVFVFFCFFFVISDARHNKH